MTGAAVAWRVMALIAILVVCFAIAAGVVGLGDSAPSEPAARSSGLLLLVCFLEVVPLSYVILRSRWHGWQLMAAIFVVFYGVTTFMAQIESAVFITRLPAGTLPRLFAFGALVAAPFSVLSVLVLGKRKPDPVSEREPNARLIMPASEWTWKLAIIIVAYLVLYFTFGYFIAWRNPAVQDYYGGSDPGSFAAQMQSVVGERPWLIPFQVFRAICWVILALPVIRMLEGGRLEASLAVAAIFSVVMNAQLLLPNPYMPGAVRMAHLMETATSNFVFGALVGWLLADPHVRARVAIAGTPH